MNHLRLVVKNGSHISQRTSSKGAIEILLQSSKGKHFCFTKGQTVQEKEPEIVISSTDLLRILSLEKERCSNL